MLFKHSLRVLWTCVFFTMLPGCECGQGRLTPSPEIPPEEVPRPKVSKASTWGTEFVGALPQVFTLIESLSGTAPRRLHRKLMATETGRSLLEQQPDIVPLLSNRAALRAMPAGSLAHAYVAFVESENISAEGLVEAAAVGGVAPREDQYAWQRDRLRDTHDLWHTVTGYQGDVLGELSLLAFLLGQNWHPGIATALAGAFSRGLSGSDGWLVADGYVRGKRAAWLPAQPWEELLPLPLTEVRERLSLGAPPKYEPLRSSELRARGVVGPHAEQKS